MVQSCGLELVLELPRVCAVVAESEAAFSSPRCHCPLPRWLLDEFDERVDTTVAHNFAFASKILYDRFYCYSPPYRAINGGDDCRDIYAAKERRGPGHTRSAVKLLVFCASKPRYIPLFILGKGSKSLAWPAQNIRGPLYSAVHTPPLPPPPH